MRHLAARTGGIVNASQIADRLGVDAHLVGDFVTLLESVFLVHRLQPFGRTLSGRVARSPKVHAVDSGLAAHLLGITDRRLAARTASTLTEFGHVLETFAVNELVKQAGWSQESVEFGHFRTRDQAEVDLVVQTHALPLDRLWTEPGGASRPRRDG